MDSTTRENEKKVTDRDEHRELRDQIIQSCFDLVSSDGMSSLSMRDVADEAGTTTQMIYTLFGNKQNLIESLFQTGSELMLEQCQNTDPDLPAELRLYQMGKQYRKFALENRKIYEALFSSELAGDDVIRKTELFELTVEELQECFDRGLLKNGDPETVTETFWAGIHGTISLEISGLYEDEEAAEEAYLEVLRSIFDGYRIEDPSEDPDIEI